MPVVLSLEMHCSPACQQKLAKEGWEVPSLAKGYILLKDAHLPDKARDLIEMWSGGVYEYADMQKWLKRLERPIPGSGGLRLTGLTAFTETATPDAASGANTYAAFEESLTFMSESLFLLPEAYDDDWLEENAYLLEDPDIVCVAGDCNVAALLQAARRSARGGSR